MLLSRAGAWSCPESRGARPYVLQAYDERPVSRGEVRSLARPSREGIANALNAAGIAEPRAKALCSRQRPQSRRPAPADPWSAWTPPEMGGESRPCAAGSAPSGGVGRGRRRPTRPGSADIADQPYAAVIAALASYVGEHKLRARPEQPAGHVRVHCSPKHGSWLNLVEGFFLRNSRPHLGPTSSIRPPDSIRTSETTT